VAYQNQEDARTNRANLYFSKSETELLSEWAKAQRSQKGALMRNRIVQIAKSELEAFKSRDRMTMMALSDLQKLNQ